MRKPIGEKLKSEGHCFIPAGSELIDVKGKVHTTLYDQKITRYNFGVVTDQGYFIPKMFVYLNLN